MDGRVRGGAAINEARLRLWAWGLLVTTFGLALLWAIATALAAVSTAVATLTLGAVIAFVLEPLARRLDRLLHSRVASALVLLVLIIALAATAVAYLGVAALREAQALALALPALVARAERDFPTWLAVAQRLSGGLSLASLVQTLLARFETFGRGALTYSIAILAGATQAAMTAIIAIVVAFYFILDGSRLHAASLALLPPAWRPTATATTAIVARVLGGFLRSQLLIAGLFGLLVGIGMRALGLPYPLLLGLQAAVFELLPTVGPVLAAVAPGVIALGMPYPTIWYVLLFLFAAQQLEGNLLVPRISGNAVGLHPVAVIISILAGFQLGGLLGAVAAVPLTGTAYALARAHLVSRSIDA